MTNDEQAADWQRHRGFISPILLILLIGPISGVEMTNDDTIAAVRVLRNCRFGGFL